MQRDYSYWFRDCPVLLTRRQLKRLSAPFEIHWSGINLDELIIDELVKPGNWTASRLYEQVDTAYYWKMKPSVFGICEPDEDASLMHAYKIKSQQIEQWERHLAKEDAERRK